VCTIRLALFIALASAPRDRAARRGGGGTGRSRRVHSVSLDQISASSRPRRLISYGVLHHQAPYRRRSSAPAWLGFTIPFPLYGIFQGTCIWCTTRMRREPADLLLTDRPLLAAWRYGAHGGRDNLPSGRTYAPISTSAFRLGERRAGGGGGGYHGADPGWARNPRKARRVDYTRQQSASSRVSWRSSSTRARPLRSPSSISSLRDGLLSSPPSGPNFAFEDATMFESPGARSGGFPHGNTGVRSSQMLFKPNPLDSFAATSSRA